MSYPHEKIVRRMWCSDATTRMKPGLGKPGEKALKVAITMAGVSSGRIHAYLFVADCNGSLRVVTPRYILLRINQAKRIIYFLDEVRAQPSKYDIDYPKLSVNKISAALGYLRITLWENFGYFRLYSPIYVF